MDDEACKAVGSVVALIGDMLQRSGICSMTEFANRIGGMAMMASETGPEFERRGEMLATMAFCVLAYDKGRDMEPGEQLN